MGREGEQGELTLLDLLGLVRVRKRRRRHSVVELDGKQRVRYAGVLFIMSTYSYDIFVVLLWYECGAVLYHLLLHSTASRVCTSTSTASNLPGVLRTLRCGE